MKKVVVEDLEYLFSKVNWSASMLDSKAIEIMNNITSRIDGRIEQREITSCIEYEEEMLERYIGGEDLPDGWTVEKQVGFVKGLKHALETLKLLEI